MFPLLPIGPLNLSSGGLLLLIGLFIGSTLFERRARARLGTQLAEQAPDVILPVLIGAAIGGRLIYGLLNWDLYASNPGLFLGLRIAEMAWIGALPGGLLVGWLWCRWKGFDGLRLADAAAFGLLPAQVIASLGLLLSGEAFGKPTSLPWGITLFGANRHPTQIYLALTALLGYGLLVWLARHKPRAGILFVAYVGFQGLTMLLLEPLRGDSLLLPYGIRAAQVLGLGLLLAVLAWLRMQALPMPSPVPTSAPHNQA